MGFGTRIKELIKKKNITIKELSERTNIPVNTLYSITARDSNNAKMDTISKIASALGVTIDYLIGTDTSEELKKQYEIKRGVFIDYLYSLGFSVETPLSPNDYPSYHCIGVNNRSTFKVVDANDFNVFQEECNKYISYLMNNLLEQSLSIEDYFENEEYVDTK